MSKITIGLPVYNGEATVEATLDALLAQTYHDFTLLVSDNASTDATPAVLTRYAQRDSRIRVVRHPSNMGSTANFWYLIESAQTPLFGWCAADDVPQPTYIERCLKGLEAAPGAAICCCDVIFVLASGERARYLENLDAVGCDIDDRLHRLMILCEWYALYGIGRREQMLACGPLGTRYGADVTWMAELLCSWEIACVREPLLHYAYGPRNPEGYAVAMGDKGPIAKRPMSQMLGDIGAAVARRAPDTVSGNRSLRAMARTVAFENELLCDTILAENRILGKTLSDAERFAFFYCLFTKSNPEPS